MTTIDRLRFACDLATADVDGFTKSERRQWEERLQAFFYAGPDASVIGQPSGVDYPTDWRNLRVAAAQLMATAAGTQHMYRGLVLHYRQDVVAGGREEQSRVIVSGSIMSVFARVLTDALIAEGTGQIRACRQCGEPFVRSRADNWYCQRSECVAKRQASYFQKYIRTPKGRKARKRQLAKQNREQS